MEYERDQLKLFTLSKLKKIGKDLKIKGAYKWNSRTKNDAIDKILEYKNAPEQPMPSVSTMKITQLKALAKELKVPRYSTYKKSDIEVLRELVLEKMNTDEPQVVDEQPRAIIQRIELPADISTMKITQLKALAKKLKVPRYRTYKKSDIDVLRRLILDYAPPPEEVEPDDQIIEQTEEEEVIPSVIPEFLPAKQAKRVSSVHSMIMDMKNTDPPSDSIEDLQKIIKRCLLTV